MAGRCKTRRSFAVALVTGSVLLSSVLSAEMPATPTFTRDIAPIFQTKCEACHRPDSIAPMSLRTYDEVRPWARAIRARVEARQMPPWHIDKTVGIQEFKNDRSLTDRPDCHHRRLGRPGRQPRRAQRHAARPGCGRAIRGGITPRCSARRNRI